jgi:hypothetical protein
MAILGDSIAAATLADLPIPDAPTPEESVLAWRDQGYEAEWIYTNKRKLSWGSGEALRSHYVLLREWMARNEPGQSLEALNVAVPGSTTADLKDQVHRVLTALHSGNYRGLKYLAFTIGSNDACSGGDSNLLSDSVRRNLEEALTALWKGIPRGTPLRVLVVGAPRIPNLGTPAFLRAQTLFGLSCSTVRDHLLRMCTPLTVWTGNDQYLERLAIVERVNASLRSTALELESAFPGLEVAYSDRLFQLEIPLGALAADCFHPGKWAQELISTQTWRDQPWFR